MAGETRKVGAEVFVDAEQANQEFAKVKENINEIGNTAKSSGAAASAAMNGFTSSSGAAAAGVSALGKEMNVAILGYAELKRQIDLNKAASKEMGVSIAEAQVRLSQMRQTVVDLANAEKVDTEALKLARQEYAAFSAEIGTVIASRRELNAETQQMSIVLGGLAKPTEDVAAKTLTLNQNMRLAAFGLKDGGLAVGGFTRQLGLLSTAFSTAGFAQLALLFGIGLLIGEMSKLFKSSEDHVQITTEVLKNNQLLVQVFEQLSAATGHTNVEFEKQVAQYRRMTEANFNALLINYVDNYHLLQDATNKASEADLKAQKTSELHRQAVEDAKNSHINMREVLKTTEDAQVKAEQATISATNAQGEQQKETDKDVQAFVQLVASGQRTVEQMMAVAAAAHYDANAMEYLRGRLLAAADAQYQLNEAARNYRPPAVALAGRDSTLSTQQKDLDETVKRMQADGNTLGQIVAATKPKLDALKQTAAESVASMNADKVLSFAEAHKKLADTMTGGYETIQKLNSAMPTYDANLKTATADHEKHAKAAKSTAAAVHAAAQAEDAYAAKLLQSQAALEKDTFDQKSARIAAEAQIMEEKARQDAKYSAQKRAHLQTEINFIHQWEVNENEKLNQDKLQALEALDERIKKMEISHIVDIRQRKLEEIDHEVRKEYEAAVLKFGWSFGLEVKFLVFKKQLLDEYHTWEAKENEKATTKRIEEEARFQNALEEEQKKHTKTLLDNMVKALKDLHNAQSAIGSQIGGNIANPANAGQVNAILKQIDELGGAYGGLGTEEERVKAALAAVVKLFGTASHDANTLKKELDGVKQSAAGNLTTFDAFKIRMKALSDETKNNKTAAQEWAEAWQAAVSQMGSSIEQGFEGIVNGTTTFGQLMKKLTADLIATIAEHWGKLWLIKGAVDIWTDPALGAAELAGGAALLALAGALHALGGSGSSHAASGGSAAAANGASSPSAAAASSPVSSQPRQPLVIPFNTSGQPQVTEVHVHLTDDAGKNFLKETFDGHGVIRLDTMTRQHSTQIKKFIKSVKD